MQVSRLRNILPIVFWGRCLYEREILTFDEFVHLVAVSCLTSVESKDVSVPETDSQSDINSFSVIVVRSNNQGRILTCCPPYRQALAPHTCRGVKRILPLDLLSR